MKKDLVEVGIGVASVVIAEVLGTTIYKMQKDGKLNKKEGEKMMRDTIAKVRATGTRYAKQANSQMSNLAKASPFATKREMAQLNAKIDKLIKSQKARARKR